ncbi:MAG: hypothetical protein Kow0042_00350 [Calditrichia bacterium]
MKISAKRIFRIYRVYYLLLLLPGLLPAQQVTKGPYLADPRPEGISIRWECDTRATGQIIYQDQAGSQFTVPGILLGTADGGFLYQAELTNLQPGKSYRYRLQIGSRSSAEHQFRSPPAPNASLRFVVMGDSRSNPRIFQKVNALVEPLQPGLIISMGDLVASGGRYEEWEKYYFSPAAKLIAEVPLISTLGDHEGDDDNGRLFAHFLFPKYDPQRLWFSFDFGPAHFVSLDYRHPENPEMIKWFRQDMGQSRARWKFVFMHRPCYDLGGHRSHWGSGVWPELFRVFRVDLVFAGHSHLYERFFPVRPENKPDEWPVTYITSGGAGAGLYEAVSSPFLAASQSINHFLLITLSGDSLRLRAYDLNNTVFDSLILAKSGGNYDSAYLARARSQELLDLTNMFARELSFSLSLLPVGDHPAKHNLTLKSVLPDSIPFRISLADSGMEFWQVESLSGVLPPSEGLKLPLHIYRKGEITVSRWGDIAPALQLRAEFERAGETISVTGAKIDYWPGGD